MSFILDALRKSEHERQINAGQNMGLLYQIEIKRNHNLWIIPIAVVMTVLILIAFIWRIWLQPSPVNNTKVNTNQELNSGSQTQTNSQQKTSAPISIHEKQHSDSTQNKKHATHHDTNEISQPFIIETGSNKTLSNDPVENKHKQGPADPLRDLPPLNITGYVHNEQSGTVAMINNQLVHEGEEISPGLRLIKILDNSAIFSYKGFIFTR
jgi:general secretion pathway protein B